MNQLVNVLLVLHIAAGTAALISGPLSMLNKKGGKAHRLTGKIFFFAMMLIGISSVSIALSPGHENTFLMLLGIFSAYIVSSGYRILYLKQLHKGQKPKAVDWLITIIMTLFAVSLTWYGIKNIIAGNSMGTVLSVFGVLALLMVKKDFGNYIKPPADKNNWLFQHITRMIAGNIAAFTAFLVVNNTILPPVVAWLLPTAIGTPTIIYYIRFYKSRIKSGKTARELVVLKISDSE